MKKLLYIIFLLLPSAALAQVKVWDKETYFDHDTKEVVIDMTVEATDIDGTVALDFVIRDEEGNRKTLPAIVYSTNSRYWHVVRAAETPWIYRVKQKNMPIRTNYTARLPYQLWMDHASLMLNQVRYEKCGDWLTDTQTIVHDIMVEPTPQVEIAPEPQIWRPDPQLYARMVGFINPAVEGIKHRATVVKLDINYPVNVYKVMPTYMNNTQELAKVDTMMNILMKDDYVNINSYTITGYASPEGSYALNDRLAKNRSMGFTTYVKGLYNLKGKPIRNYWIAEDWDGVVEALKEREMSYKQEILDIIASTDIFDNREAKLMDLGAGYPYRELLTEVFPPLRRIELRADYTVRSFTDEEAKDVFHQRPELLSLDEMYRVALNYRPGTADYRRVYETAARHHPKDIIANNNAAAAALLDGDTEAAKNYLDKILCDERSYVNRGVVAYIEGDLDTAREYFRIAAQSGHEAGKSNFELLENATK